MASDVARGRPRDDGLDETVQRATMGLLRAHGYDRLRMADVAAEAGVGLGAIYRRWAGKQQLVAAALRAEKEVLPHDDMEDPVEDLLAALLRISTAMERGLARILAECLSQPEGEFAQVARTAKLDPMADEVRTRLSRIDPRLARRAAVAPAFIAWHVAAHGTAPDRAALEQELLPALGITPPSTCP